MIDPSSGGEPMSALDGANSELARAEAELARAKIELARAEARVEAAEAELARARVEIARAEAGVASLLGHALGDLVEFIAWWPVGPRAGEPPLDVLAAWSGPNAVMVAMAIASVSPQHARVAHGHRALLVGAFGFTG